MVRTEVRPAVKSSELSRAFDLLDVKFLDDLTRIKKPSKHAFDCCYLFAAFLNIFKAEPEPTE